MEKNITILIADDEKPARERLKGILNSLGYDISGEAINGDDAMSQIAFLKPQIAFLDINMPGTNVFNGIKSLDKPPVIIFQTAYSEFAADAFDIDAIDYILKPYSVERVKQSLDKALKFLRVEMESDTGKLNTDENIFLKFLSVREGSSIKLVDTDKMTRICFEEGFSFLYAEGRRFLTDKSLNDYEKILEPKVFFRTSRTDIVNISLIDSIHPVCNGHFIIELKDKSKIPLSRRRAKELRKILNF